MKKLILCLFVLMTVCCACTEKKEEKIDEPVINEPTAEEVAKEKKTKAEETMYNLKKSAEVYYAEKQFDSQIAGKQIRIDFSIGAPSDFVFSGVTPEKGVITINSDKDIVMTNMVVNGFMCHFDDNKVICE